MGEGAADLLHVGEVIKGRALIPGMAVPADTQGHFSRNLPFPEMSSSFSMTGLALDPPEIERDLFDGSIFSHLPVTGRMTDQTFLLAVFGRRGDGLGRLGVFGLQPILIVDFMTFFAGDGPNKGTPFGNAGDHLLLR